MAEGFRVFHLITLSAETFQRHTTQKWPGMQYLLFKTTGFRTTSSRRMKDKLLSRSLPDFTFREQPTSVVAEEDKSARFHCQANYTGAEKPVIRWYKNGEQNQLEDTARRYMLSNGTLYFKIVSHLKSYIESDQGDYRCSATVPSLGTIVSRKATLTIAYIPKHFEVEPKDLQVSLGDYAAFECLINGQPPAKVTWYKKSNKLNTPLAKVFPTGLLELGPITLGDFSSYACEAESHEHSRTSRMANLTQISGFDARPSAPKFIIRPRDQKVVKNERAYLHCVAYGRDRLGNTPVISWLKDGSTILLHGKNSSSVSMEGSGTLVITNASESDAGVYTCRAVNSEDSVDADASLTVSVPPRFKVTPKSMQGETQSDLTLQCEAEGMPQPVISWMKDGEPIKPQDYFLVLPGGSLKILGLLPTDKGMYQCFAENELGQAQVAAYLDVISKAGALYSESYSQPPVPINLKAALVSPRFITITWDLPEKPEAKDVTQYFVVWREAGSERQRTSNTTSREFNIQGLKSRTKYEIHVRSYNSKGVSQEEAKLTVTTGQDASVPSPPMNLQAIPISSAEIHIKWEPPLEPNGIIKSYFLFYYKVGSKVESEVTVSNSTTSYTMRNLRTFKEYSVRVVAVNENGHGASTSEVLARTYSGTPSEAPRNFTVVATNSKSLRLSWLPPPEDAQNGIITGYKIRYRTKGLDHKNAETLSTDGERKNYALTNLQEGTEYQVRIAAMTINGTGPNTPWETVTTFKEDLQENDVPGVPALLIAQTKANSILVSWAPPSPHSKILVRGYVLGYGKGIADVYKHTLDANSQDFHIKNLQPNSQYVISIRAFNYKGQGPSKYETVNTPEEMHEEQVTPMLPPVGLKAHVLSSTTIMLTWSDNSLSRNQRIMDDRYYTIKYRQLNLKNSKFKYINATDLNYHIESLRPHTEYEFMVKVIKGRRESDYSMTVVNKTEESAPLSEPRDVTPVGLEKNPFAVSLNWQPPLRPNGQITGYLIYYTHDEHTNDMLWPMEGVVGDKLSTVIDKLTPDTRYHFKVQARNSKGLSPKSETATYRTPPKTPTGQENTETEKGLTTNVIIIIAACAAGFVFCTVVIVIIVCLCRWHGGRSNNLDKSQSKVTKIPPPSVKPPDLWIHQPSHLELQNMERSNRSESSASVATSTLRRGSRGSADQTDDQASTLDRRRNSFIDDRGYPSSGEERYQPIQSRNLIRPKPVALLPEAQFSLREPIPTVTPGSNGHILQYGDNTGSQIPLRPVYPRTQYNTQYQSAARVNAGDLPHTCPPTSKILCAVDEDDGSLEMSGGMEESFNSRIGYVKPQQSISPYKKPTAPVMSTPNKGSRTPISFNSKSPDLKSKKDDADLSKSLSTEELTAEMANLEGLMKDLNAITQQEFEC
nr:neogenin-like; partial [Biomphalaria glabrata]